MKKRTSSRLGFVTRLERANRKPITPTQGEPKMNPRDDERQSGAVDQEAFEKVIRDNLSPEAVASIIAFLQPAAFYKPANEDAMNAQRQVEWFADTLTAML